MKGLLYFVLLMFIPAAFAGPFNPPPTDQSVSLLGVIFSGNVGSIYLGGAQSNSVFASLMEKFNFIIVVGGLIIVSYVAVLSTINTAQEGSAMGKSWSAIWIPMRSIAGLALLVPAPSTGYSMIQVTVMWIVLQGIGAADSLWNIALEGLYSGVSVTMGSRPSQLYLSQLQNHGTQLVPLVLDADICMKTFFQLSTQPASGGTFVQQYGQSVKPFNIMSQNFAATPDTSGSGSCYTVTGNYYFGINDGNPRHMDLCGQIPITAQTCPSEYLNANWTTPPTQQQLINDAQSIYNVKVAAIDAMLKSLEVIAQGYATNSYAWPAIKNAPLGTQAPWGATAAAAGAYATNMYSLVVPNGAQFGNVTNPAAAGAAYQVSQAANTAANNITAGANSAAAAAAAGAQANAGTIGAAGGAVVGAAGGFVVGGAVGAVYGGEYGTAAGGRAGLSNAGAMGSAANAVVSGAGQAASGLVSGAGQQVAGLINSVGGNTQNTTSSFGTLQSAINQGMQNGWISAGSFYFIFNRSMTSTLFKSAVNDSMPGAATAPSCASGTQGGSCYSGINPASGTSYGSAQPDNATDLDNVTTSAELNTIADNLAFGSSYIANDTATTSSQLNFSAPSSSGVNGNEFTKILNDFNNFGLLALNEMEKLFNNLGCVPGTSYQVGPNQATQTCGQMDPLMAHAIFGRDVMIGCESIFSGVLVTIIATLVGFKVGAFFAPAPVAYVVGGIMLGTMWLLVGVLSWVFPLLMWLWTFGAMLAIYCPLIPFMIFTIGALGWMLAVTEAVIAAPLAALGIIIPSEDEMGRMGHAVEILTNIFLRPVLMIFGFILASGLYRAVVQLIDFGIGAVYQTIAVSTMFSFVVLITVYVSFIISVTNTCFSLIYTIPDKILRWIGGVEEDTGKSVASAMEEVKGAAKGSAQMLGEAMQKGTIASAKLGGGMMAGGATSALQGKGFSSGALGAARKAFFGSGGDEGGGGASGGGGGGSSTPPASGGGTP